MTEEQRNQFVERGAEWAVGMAGRRTQEPREIRAFRLSIAGGWAARGCFNASGLDPNEQGPVRDAFTEGASAVFKLMGVI